MISVYVYMIFVYIYCTYIARWLNKYKYVIFGLRYGSRQFIP